MGVFVLMVAGLIVALTNENFAVTRELTTVRGLQRVAEEDVRRASQLEGTNIFRIQTGQVAKNVKAVARRCRGERARVAAGADRDRRPGV